MLEVNVSVEGGRNEGERGVDAQRKRRYAEAGVAPDVDQRLRHLDASG